MTLNLRNEAKLMSEFTEAMSASDVAMEKFNNFVIRSTAARAKDSIRSGAKSGNVYFRKNPDRYVQASAPGEAPANDLGNLADSITFQLFGTREKLGSVSVLAFYAADLEFGTSKIAPRPFLTPAFYEALAAAQGRFSTEFEANL